MHINWRVKLVPTRDWAVYFYIISLKKEAYDQESSKINHALKRSRKVLIYHAWMCLTSFSIAKAI